MSHIATVAVEIRDLDALDRACQRLGLELRRGQTTYKWWGNVGPRAEMSADQVFAFLKRREPGFTIPSGMSLEDWKAGTCLHAIVLPGSAHGFEIGVTRSKNGQNLTLLGDLDLLSADFSNTIGGPHCGKLVQAYSLEVAKRQMQLKGFRVQERTTANKSVQLVCVK